MQCQLFSQEVQKLLVELQHNGEKALKLEGGLDTETPHITTRIEMGSRKIIQIFGGLQAPNNILFDVTTTYHSSNEVRIPNATQKILGLKKIRQFVTLTLAK